MDVLPSEDHAKVLREDFGGKAEGLARLLALNAPVPDTLFVRWSAGDIDRIMNAVEEELTKWQRQSTDRPSQLILRSSHSEEDSETASMAGLHDSLVIDWGDGQDIGENLRRCLEEESGLLKRETGEIGGTFVIQPFVETEIGGVFFTTDPTAGRKGQGLLSYVRGPCSALVDGSVEPETLPIAKDGEFPDCSSHPEFLKAVWKDVVTTSWRLEDVWGVPLDLEFVIDRKGRLFFVQARPIASLTRWESRGPVPVREAASLPTAARSHPKISLRFRCERSGAPISPAWLVTITAWGGVPRLALPKAAYTAVCIVPRLVGGEVVRRFSRDAQAGVEFVGDVTDDYWVRHIFLAELWPSSVTGMAMEYEGAVVLEFARGHFVPKGFVATNVVEVRDERVMYLHREDCLEFYDVDFESGRPVLRSASNPLDCSVGMLRRVARVFRDLELSRSECLEFAVSPSGEVFVIDIQEMGDGALVQPDGVSISRGDVAGELIYVEARGCDESEHLHAAASQYLGAEGRPVVVSADRPQLGLIHEFTRLARRGLRVEGVVFEQYSPLAHLSLLLREWGVSAVALPGFRERGWSEGTRVRLRAGSETCSVEVSE